MFTVGKDVYLMGTYGDDHHVPTPYSSVGIYLPSTSCNSPCFWAHDEYTPRVGDLAPEHGSDEGRTRHHQQEFRQRRELE